MTRPNFSLHGKVAVVTGASRGIGSAVASALAHSGAAVMLLGRDRAALAASASALIAGGCTVGYERADVTELSTLEAAFDTAMRTLGPIDILINNAGIEEVCPSLDVSEALWDRIVGTNLKGAFFAAQAAARRMPCGGCIINICSLTSEVGIAGAAPYGASKSGLVGVTRALAAEWAERGIRVNGIGPGYFRTALTESFYRDEQWQHAMLAKIPLRRFGQLDDVGGTVVFLCSEAAAYITGQIVYVDGGYLAAL
jgi:NAD(P)-dependent dehydrogenase (short-subunit alcohol dehydrogenase family)